MGPQLLGQQFISFTFVSGRYRYFCGGQFKERFIVFTIHSHTIIFCNYVVHYHAVAETPLLTVINLRECAPVVWVGPSFYVTSQCHIELTFVGDIKGHQNRD